MSLRFVSLAPSKPGLEARGLPHIVLDPHSLSEIWANLRRVGGWSICGAPFRSVATTKPY